MPTSVRTALHEQCFQKVVEYTIREEEEMYGQHPISNPYNT